MGSHPTPFFANLFLFYYEWQYIILRKKENATSARKLSLIQIYIWSNYHQQWESWENCPEYLFSWAGTQKGKPN